MIKAQYSLIVEIVRPGLSGKMDFLGVFDRVYASELPAVYPSLFFVVLLVAETEDDFGKKLLKVSFVDPSGRKILEQSGEVAMKPVAGTYLATTQFVLQLNGLPLPLAGKYAVVVEVDGKVVTRHPLSVVVQSPPK
jgi:hypothetical protein